MNKKKVALIAAILCVSAIVGAAAACTREPLNNGTYVNGVAAVQKDGLWGFADENGDIVIDCIYDEASAYFGNFALVRQGGRYFLIDRQGNNTGIYTRRMTNSDIGTADLSLMGTNDMKLIIICDESSGLYGMIDAATGEWKISPVYDRIDVFTQELFYGFMGDRADIFYSDGTLALSPETEVWAGDNAVIVWKNFAQDGAFVADVYDAHTFEKLKEDITVTACEYLAREEEIGLVLEDSDGYLYTTGLNSGTALYYEYVNADGKHMQVVPGAGEYDLSAERAIYADGDICITAEKSDAGIVYNIYDKQGSALFEGGLAQPLVYFGGLVMPVSGADGATEYLIMHTATGNYMTVAAPYEQAVYAAYNEWYYIIDGKVLNAKGEDMGYGFTGTMQAEIYAIDGNLLVSDSAAGGVLQLIDKEGNVVHTFGIGEVFVDCGNDLKWMTTRNSDGYITLYDGSGNVIFGADKKIENLAFPTYL